MCWVFHRIVAQFLFAAVPVAEAQAGLLEQVPVRDAAAAGQDALVAAVEAGSSSGVFGPASQPYQTTTIPRQVFRCKYAVTT
jgi:hypothetical protein